MTLALILGFAISATAQGTAASPKLRESLGNFYQHHAVIAVPVEAQAMNCPMCKDELMTRTDYTARGAIKPTVTVATHACKMCGTQLKTVGVGKSAKTIAIHGCDHVCSIASAN